ncbi:bifunctional diguanylate cyclase/phosphodiesterase [Methylococcus capsulatus]|uniref:bifunctional diguanylate cyclase/phosphodiesterase n=1 Tax=Methylococcus capsulatus TaxID=414 RepID=UPI00211AD029|nr:bifunctional diguanylate cyclase/phosphodiesterase [Methylococcus capsulatus]
MVLPYGQPDLIYFFDGLSFILLAAVCGAIHDRSRQRLPWLWLGMFGIAHGADEWLDLFAASLGDHPVFAWARLAVLTISFLCLFHFGVQGLVSQGVRLPVRRVYLVQALVFVGVGLLSPSAGGGSSGVLYDALGLPGALAAVGAFVRAARTARGRYDVALVAAALAMAVFAVSLGVAGSGTSRFPPATLTAPLLRALCALAMGAGIWLHYRRSGELPVPAEELSSGLGFGVRLVLVASVVLGAAFVLTELFGHAADRSVRRELSIQAETVAASINPEWIRQVRTGATEVREREEHWLISQLLRIDAADPKLKGLYLLIPAEGGAMRAIGSSAGDIEPPRNGVEGRGWPNTEHAEAVAGVFTSGRSRVLGLAHGDGKDTVSAFAPVRDTETGEIFAALGLEIDAAVRRDRVAAYRVVAIAIALLIAMGTLGFEVSRQRLWLSSRIAKAERRRLAEAQRLARVGSWVYDPATDRMTWSEETYRIFGLPFDGEVPHRYQEFAALFALEDRELIEAALRGGRDDLLGVERPLCVRRADGAVRQVNFKVELQGRRGDSGPVLQGTLQDVTERWEAERALRQSEERLRLHVEHLPLAVIEWDLDFIVSRWNPAAERIFGYGADRMIGRSAGILFPEDVLEQAEAIWREVSGGSGNRVVTANVTADGRTIRCEWYNTPLTTPDGTVIGVASLVDDITRREAVEAELRLAATTFETDEAILIAGADGRILRVNAAFSRITGYRQEDVVGRNPRLFKSGLHGAEFYREVWRSLEQTGRWQGEIWNRRKNGEVYPERKTITAVRSANGDITHYVAISSDISELKRTEEKIRQLAYYDSLTGLPNRSLIFERLTQQMKAARREGTYGALLFMDLDYFKTLNDSLGHHMGDRLLVQVAERLKNCLEDEEAAARLGGDEFVVLLAPVKPSASVAAGQAIVHARRVRELLSAPFQLDDYVHYISVSIGIALFPDGANTAEDVLKQADTAMYVAKNEGRDGVRFYESAMEAVVRGRLDLEKALRKALANDEFEVYYQPQMLGDGRVVGAEALIRWFHPERGAISPDQFIPVCEQNGMILRVGAIVLRRACACLAEIRARGLALPKLSVNVSPRQFMRSDLMTQLEQFCLENGVSPADLCLELTEGVLLNHTELAVAQIGRLKNLGVSFSIDDFGTGYSSLAYLKHLPLDDLKIASAFVRDLEQDSSDAAIVETIVSMARHLGLDVIAEGVETRTQVEILERYGCHRFQGNYFARPLPKDDFIRFVAERQRRA